LIVILYVKWYTVSAISLYGLRADEKDRGRRNVKDTQAYNNMNFTTGKVGLREERTVHVLSRAVYIE